MNQRRPVDVLSYDPRAAASSPPSGELVRQRPDRPVPPVRGRGRSIADAGASPLTDEPHRVHPARRSAARASSTSATRSSSASTDYDLTDDQWQVILGGTLGDGSLRRVGTHAATFRVGHSPAQKDYLRVEARDARALRPRDRADRARASVSIRSTMPALADLAPRLLRRRTGHASRLRGGARSSRRARARRVVRRRWIASPARYARWGKGKAVLYNKALHGCRRDARGGDVRAPRDSAASAMTTARILVQRRADGAPARPDRAVRASVRWTTSSTRASGGALRGTRRPKRSDLRERAPLCAGGSRGDPEAIRKPPTRIRPTASTSRSRATTPTWSMASSSTTRPKPRRAGAR